MARSGQVPLEALRSNLGDGQPGITLQKPAFLDRNIDDRKVLLLRATIDLLLTGPDRENFSEIVSQSLAMTR
jgi:hypothetical protein